MIKQVIHIKHYWKIIVYYDIDYNLFDYIGEDLVNINFPVEEVYAAHHLLSTGEAKALTASNSNLHISVVVFNRHKSYFDYINSIVHEAEHVKQAMLYAYNVEDKGEPPAYTIGYIAMKMLEIFKVLYK